MTHIEKWQMIDRKQLSGEEYFASVVKEAYNCGLLGDSDIERLQMECIRFLAYKCERYNSGDSSSVRVEIAENIMKSNLYTIGLYLKMLPDVDNTVNALKSEKIEEMYRKGRKLIEARLETAKQLYRLVRSNSLNTPCYTYNATLSDNGIGNFFKLYNPDYGAHETVASIDYQLCNPVVNLAGIEFIQKYLFSLYMENEFCKYFSAEDIHRLLSGYDMGYKDLLLNIFEHVLTGAVACILAKRSVTKLYYSEDDIRLMQHKLSVLDEQQIASEVRNAAEKVQEELHIAKPSLRSYIAKCLPKITAAIINAVRIGTLDKTFPVPVDPDMKPRIEFLSGRKMEDEDYRNFIYEVLSCRYSADKLAIINEKIKSFGDFEDMLLDARLTRKEMTAALRILGDVELAALSKRHPFEEGVGAADLSEDEQKLRTCIHTYISGLKKERQNRIYEIISSLVDEDEKW